MHIAIYICLSVDKQRCSIHRTFNGVCSPAGLAEGAVSEVQNDAALLEGERDMDAALMRHLAYQ